MKKLLSALMIFTFMGIAGAADISDLTKKAGGGDADAMYELGMAYANGDGVAADDTKAVNWLEKAAKKGHDEAMAEVGLLIYEGIGTKADRVKACSYLYTTTVDAAAYVCTQLTQDERTKALAESEKLKKSLGR